MKKIYKLIFVLFLFLPIISLTDCSFKKKKKYNVVLIVVDTLRADHLPFYGYKKNTAPFLNSLSKKAVLFKHTFSASSWTAPATASIFTSLYPFQHGVLMCLLAIKRAMRLDPTIKVNKIPPQITTIPEVLKKEGYLTYGISDNLNIGKIEGFDQGFDKLETYGYKKAPFITQKTLSWKNKLKSQKKYFLFIQFMDPHAPYHKREPWYEPKDDFKKDRVSRYDSEINFVDSYIEKLYKEFQWDKNTLLIITSDHGEGLWDHGHMDHGQSLYLEEIEVPLLIIYPEIREKKVIYTNVSTIDILPTIRGILNLNSSSQDEGLNLVPLIKNRDIPKYKKRILFSYLWKKTDKLLELKASIMNRWHLIFNPKKEFFLFDMSEDKKEKFNLYKKFPQKVTFLKNSFNKFFENSKKYKKVQEKVKIGEKTLKKLKSLGYVK